VVVDEEKVAEVVHRVLAEVGERKGGYVMDEARAKAEASRCRDNCDLCFYACPNAVQVSRGVRAVKKGEGLKALGELEKRCCLFGKCDEACPEKIPISDMMVAAYAQKAADDKFLFRGGRGGNQRHEIAAYDYTTSTGNSPGWFAIVGCGRANAEDVQWMANELGSRNAIVGVAGCAVGDIAHYYDPDERKWFMQKYPFWMQPRAVGNYGGCSACQFLPTMTLKNARTVGVSHYTNFTETVAVPFERYSCSTIIWGPIPERMYTIAAALARSGSPVVVGPLTEVDWKRVMPGNKWDWQRYWAYESLKQRKKAVEPSPRHLIFPVETKEEAVTMAACFNVKPAQGFRMGFLEGWLGTHESFFGELPDDWPRFVRSPADLPIAQRVRLINELVNNHGWKIEGMTVKEVPHPDGRRLSQREYLREYGMGDMPSARIRRLCLRPVVERKP
jgi:acetyl-CoA decarbonylase/synthase complex subunit alpha